MKNPLCDGGFCVLDVGEVKKYPVGDDSHMILCVHCWGHENRFREDMSKEHGTEWPRPSWFHAELYDNTTATPEEPPNKADIIRKFAKEHGLTVVELPDVLGMEQPKHLDFDAMPSLEEVIADINSTLGFTPKK